MGQSGKTWFNHASTIFAQALCSDVPPALLQKYYEASGNHAKKCLGLTCPTWVQYIELYIHIYKYACVAFSET